MIATSKARPRIQRSSFASEQVRKLVKKYSAPWRGYSIQRGIGAAWHGSADPADLDRLIASPRSTLSPDEVAFLDVFLLARNVTALPERERFLRVLAAAYRSLHSKATVRINPKQGEVA